MLLQELAGLLTVSHLDVSMDAMGFLTKLILFPMPAGTNFSDRPFMFDKKVCAALQKKTTVIGALVSLGILIAGKNLTAKEIEVANTVSRILEFIFGSLGNRWSFRFIKMEPWSNRR